MSLLKAQDPNRGPLTLQHDTTPRDLSQFNEAVDVGLSGDFRYKGWPERDFLAYRHPARRTKEELQLEKKRLFGYPIYSYEERRPEVLESQADPVVEVTTAKSSSGEKRKLTSENQDPSPEKEEPSSEGEDFRSGRKKLSSETRKEPSPGRTDPYVERLSLAGPGQDLAPDSGSPRSVRDPYKQKTPAELIKIQRQMLEAEQDIQRYKQERVAKMQEDIEAKKRDLEMLQKYDPFGKPGAGAPLGDPKKKKFLEEDLTPREEIRYKQPERVRDFFLDSFGRPGGGAPLKTDSGSIRTELKADPSIRFQKRDELRQSIENHIRYHKPQNETQQYNNDLDRQIEERKISEQHQRIEELKKDIEMSKHKTPYGRPGAGAPNRTISGTGTTDYEHHNGTSLNLKVTGGAGAPHFNEDGNVVTRLPATMRANEFGQHEIKEETSGPTRRPRTLEGKAEVYFPFGRPGAGAPLRDIDGNILTTATRKINKESSSADDRRRVRAAQQYHRDLAIGMEEHEMNKREFENYRKAPVGELASILREGQVGKPKRDRITGMLVAQNLGTSDVTQMKIQDFNYRAVKDSRGYHEDLRKAAEERYRSRELDKMKEKQEARHHEQVFSDFWGRPGGGAPKNMGNYRKVNLEDTLFPSRQNMHAGDRDYVKYNPEDGYHSNRTDGHNENPEFERYMGARSRGPGAEGDSPRSQNYIRSTVKSTHANQYDFENGFKRHPKPEYHVAAPWAGNVTS